MGALKDRRLLVIVLPAFVILAVLFALALTQSGNSQNAPPAEAAATATETAATDAPPPVVVENPTAQPAATARPPAGPTPTVAGGRPTLLPTPTLAGTDAGPLATVSAATPAAAPPTPLPGQGARPTLAPLPVDPANPVTNGNRDRPRIALTFDACQDPTLPARFDAALIQVLIDTGTPATLFLGGDWMRTHPDETRFVAAHPQFELGSHGYAHIDFATASVEEMVVELEGVQQTMWELVGRQPTVFRFPAGSYTDEALRVVSEQGLRPIQWEVVSGDPDPDITAERMIPWVVNQVRNGSIIIMHMNGRGWHTAEALPEIIAQLREQGYEFVTVSELLGEE